MTYVPRLPVLLLPGLISLTTACHRPAAGLTPLAPADCLDPARVNPNGICTMEYDPVCGCNGRTYANPCAARKAGVRTFAPGPCPPKP